MPDRRLLQTPLLYMTCNILLYAQMARSLPPLNALKAFEAAARHESMTLAAAELNIAHAAISRHIRKLETTLRTQLFERTGRGVILTDDGRALARSLTEALDLIDNATRRFSRAPRRRQRLTITSDVAIATHWLAARIGGFAAKNPSMEIVVDPTHRLVDFTREDFDFGIRFGAGGWKNVESEQLAAAEFSVFCHPRLLKERAIRSPPDLPGELLMQEYDWTLWPAWLEAAGATSVVPSGSALLHDLTLNAAEAGHGFALADTIVAADALFTGRLARPFPVSISKYGYYLVSRPGGTLSKSAAAFRLWIKDELSKTLAAVATLSVPNGRSSPKEARTKRRPLAR